MPLTVVRREHHHLYSRLPRSADARRAVDALLRLQHAEEQQIEHARAESGLAKNEFLAVRYLLQAHRDERAMGPKDLAVMLAVSNASVTKLVDALVESGDVVRTAHPTDRRAQVLEPTEQAASKIDAAYARFHEIVVEVFDGLSDDDNRAVAQALGQVVDGLSRAVPEPADEYTVGAAADATR